MTVLLLSLSFATRCDIVSKVQKQKKGVNRLKTSLRQIRLDLQQPGQRALLLLAMIPLFPEYISFFIVVLAGAFAWQELKQTNRPLQIGMIGKLLLVFIGYMFITILYSHNPLNSIVTVGMWAFFFLVYLILHNLLTDTDRFDSFMLYITAVAGAVGFLACCQYRIGFFVKGVPNQIWGWLDEIVYQVLPFDSHCTPYVLRACSTFSNPNILSEYLTAVAPFVVYFNFYERRPELRLFCRICLFLTFSGVLFSFSRGGYLAILVLALALVLFNLRHKFATVTLYIVCILLLLPDEVMERFLTILPGISVGGAILGNTGGQAGGGLLTEEAMNTTAEILNNSGADIAINERFRIWLQALQSFLENPVFGQGAGTEITHQIMAENNINALHTHNIALQLLMEGGIIALLIMLLIGGKVAKNGLELMRNGYSYSFWIGFAVLGFVSSFCIQGLVDYPLLTPKLIANFMMIMAIAEQSVSLYTAKGIPVRKKIRHHLKTYRQRKKQPTA